MGKKHQKPQGRRKPTRQEQALRKQKHKNRLESSRRRNKMSRREDLLAAEKRIQGLQDKIKEIHTQYQQYSDDVVASIKTILVDAGVYDQVHVLELERTETAKAAQAKVNALQQEIAKAAAAREFLLSLGQDAGGAPAAVGPEVPAAGPAVEEVPPAPEPEPVVDEPAPVPEPS